MGVLDEAIREHLELKRRHGANPEDVARAEREALGPAVRDRGTATPAAELPSDDPDASEVETTQPETTLGEAPTDDPEPSVIAPEPTPAPEPSEPVATEPSTPAPPAEPAATPAEPVATPLPAEGEISAPPSEPEAVPPPPEEPRVDQPTEVFDAGEIFDEDEDEPFRDPPPAAPEEAEAEDVLEETPEFLQETPEHDRLWFEQKPPRDFDFDG